MEDGFEICKCRCYQEVVTRTEPYFFGIYKPEYIRPMLREDGCPCEEDEYTFSRLYNKARRRGDRGAFDCSTDVKLPPHEVIWKKGPDNPFHQAFCVPTQPICPGVLGIFTHSKRALEHHRLRKLYKPPTQEFLNLLKKR